MSRRRNPIQSRLNMLRRETWYESLRSRVYSPAGSEIGINVGSDALLEVHLETAMLLGFDIARVWSAFIPIAPICHTMKEVSVGARDAEMDVH